MNRSTLRSLRAIVAAGTVVSLSMSPLATNAQPAPTASPIVDQTRGLEIWYSDGNGDGAVYVGSVSPTTPQPKPVVLAPSDVLYGDGDEGAIAQGPAPATTVAHIDVAAAQPATDLVFTDGNAGGMPFDLAAFRGRSSISAVELTGGQPQIAENLADLAQQFADAE